MRTVATRHASRNGNGATQPATKWAAAYVRQSIADSSEFGSIHAQTELIENHVKARAGDGWKLLPETFVDHGFSGATTERPALKRLLAAIAEHRVNVVVVVRLDRISRSLRDLVELIDVFRKANVEFVSVTQAFDTTTAVGRLAFNIIGGFAEYERELISERTREKLALSRQRGQFSGGRATLGYDVVNKRLVVNEEEARRLKEIVQLYLQHKSLLIVVQELAHRGWTNKSWRKKDGTVVQGKPFSAATLHQLITNPIIAGKVQVAGNILPGAHEPIIGDETRERVLAQLKENLRTRVRRFRRTAPALLQGLLFCAKCGHAMHPERNGPRGGRHYSYYACSNMKARGASVCPGSRASGATLDSAVVEQIRGIGRDPAVLEATLAAARNAVKTKRPELEARRTRLEDELQKLSEARAHVVDAIAGESGGRFSLTQRLGEIELEHTLLTKQLDDATSELLSLERATIDTDSLKTALEQFDALFETLTIAERRRLLELVVERIEYDGKERELSITFRSDGVNSLATERGQASA